MPWWDVASTIKTSNHRELNIVAPKGGRGEIRFKRMEVKQYTARLDGVSNTITGVQKDNWIYVQR